MKKIGLILLLLTLPFSIFAQSPPSDSLIQKYRKEVKKFILEMSLDSKIPSRRHVKMEIMPERMIDIFLTFLYAYDLKGSTGDNTFLQLPAAAFNNNHWDKGLIKNATLVELPQSDSLQLVFYQQFNAKQPLWSYSAPIFSPSGKWCLFSSTHWSESESSGGQTTIYKRTSKGWKSYRILRNITFPIGSP